MTYKDEVIYKVLGGWASSYVNGSSWRLNSGIVKAELNDDHYTFTGSSGSVYVCHKDSYGLRMSTVETWLNMKKTFPDQVEMLDDQNWLERDWNE
jgi:hypothetical protein